MATGSFDDATGWAEFASFECEQSSFSSEVSSGGTSANTLESSTSQPTVSATKTAEFSSDGAHKFTETEDLLNACFRCSQRDCSSSFSGLVDNFDSHLANSDGGHTRFLEALDDDIRDSLTMKWEKSMHFHVLMKTLNVCLLQQQQQSSLPPSEDLDISDDLQCFNFHNLLKTKKVIQGNRSKGNLMVTKNPASALNPFAPDKCNELVHCSSDSSICDTASCGSIDSLSVKETECSSITSAESDATNSENNEDSQDLCCTNDQLDINSQHEYSNQCYAIKYERFNQTELSKLSLDELQSIVEDIQQSSSRLSDTLVKELRTKDELLREKQIKDDFISLLLTVSRKEKQQELSQTSKRKWLVSRVLGHVETVERKIFDTTIPYFPAEDGPCLADIVSLKNILHAVLHDDPEVPQLVSNYILKTVKEMQINGHVR